MLPHKILNIVSNGAAATIGIPLAMDFQPVLEVLPKGNVLGVVTVALTLANTILNLIIKRKNKKREQILRKQNERG
ncbi:MAG: hypothetical protein EOP56_13610 [Sphingobacteriales bacterium]|nr:MAG: hypothetical protein EOP56_13610 [Sphingobacteriales bacterium]